jgi:hypothetical protein
MSTSACAYSAQGDFACRTGGVVAAAVSGGNLEHFENSCYGATRAHVKCNSCQAVKNAYNKKGWTHGNFAQCKSSDSCYGATPEAVKCKTCEAVKKAYNAKGWAHGNFAQCNQ